MVGALIRERRKARGWSQQELAGRLDMAQTYLSRLERGEVELPQRATLERLGAELGLSLADFYQAAGVLDDVGSPTPPTPSGHPRRGCYTATYGRVATN